MKRQASAQWRGNLRQGTGEISTESGVLSHVPYSFAKRFGEEKGTNPEEIIGAAHAACFSMAVAGELAQAKVEAQSIDVQATVTLENTSTGWAIPAINLDVSIDAPGVDKETIEEAAKNAKMNCPVSKLFKAVVTMNLTLSSQESTAIQ